MSTRVIGESQILLGNAAEDAFGRFRVSNPTQVFDSQQVLNNDPHFMMETETAGGTATRRADESSTRLACTSASGDKVTRESKNYIPYQPGKSQRIFATFVMSAQVTANEKRVGYFDDEDGIFFEQHATGVRFVRRTNTSGSAVDNEVEQASWNLDTLDGSGPSGVTLDETTTQILAIDLAWLGVGDVRVGFVIDGITRYVHQFNNTNTIATVYMTQSSLPLRWEIENTGTSSGTPYIDAICGGVQSEGGVEVTGIPHSYSTARVSATRVTVNSAIRAAVLSVRFSSAANARALLLPKGFAISTGSAADLLVEVTSNGTGTYTSGTTTAAGELTEVITQGTGTISASNITGDDVIFSTLVNTANNSSKESPIDLPTDVFYGRESTGVAERVSVVVTPLGGVAEDVHVSLNWVEVY